MYYLKFRQLSSDLETSRRFVARLLSCIITFLLYTALLLLEYPAQFCSGALYFTIGGATVPRIYRRDVFFPSFSAFHVATGLSAGCYRWWLR